MMNGLARPILVAIGTVSLGFGVLGIFLPVLPTTPFLLLAAYCYARSSERMHRWLLGHRRLAPYIVGFVYGGAVPKRAKRAALLTLWPTIALSCAIVLWRASSPWIAYGVPIAIIAIASAVSAYIVTRPTASEAESAE